MKDALTGLVRAVVILIVLLVVFNLLKPVIFGSSNLIQDGDTYKIPGEEDTTTETVYDNKNDYKKIYDKYDFKNVEELFGNEFLDFYYQGKTFNDDFYLYLAIVNITKNKFTLICNNSIEIEEKTVNNKINELFGEVDYKGTSYISEDKNLEIKYNEGSKTYTVSNKKCSGIDVKNGYIETSFLGGIDKENSIEIYENAYLIKQKEENGALSTVKYIGVTEVTGFSSDNKHAIYKYTFEKTTDGVRLVKIEKSY